MRKSSSPVAHRHPDGGAGGASGVRRRPGSGAGSASAATGSARRRQRRRGRRGACRFRSRNGRRSAATINKQQECHTSRKRLAATGQAIAQFLVIERGDKKLLQLAVPPVALIQPGVQVKIDNGEATGVKYVVCTPGECLALGEINADFIAKLKKGGNVTITMLNPQGKPVNFDISLVGFTADL